MTLDAKPGLSPLWTGAMLATALVLVAAVAVRGVRGERVRAPIAPQDRPRAADEFREPMQLLRRGAELRIDELSARITAEHRKAWDDARRVPFELAGCPSTNDWLASAEGQRFERLVGDLRRGTRDEALAALALIFELARKTEWKPGLLARTQHAERLGALLSDWLRTWGERGADDAMLSEVTQGALLLCSRVLRTVARPLPIGGNDAAYERGRAFIGALLVDAHGQPSALARALRARHPIALDGFAATDDGLKGFASASAQLFPDVDGACR